MGRRVPIRKAKEMLIVKFGLLHVTCLIIFVCPSHGDLRACELATPPRAGAGRGGACECEVPWCLDMIGSPLAFATL